MDRLDGSGKPATFNMKFVTADRKRNTGGEIIEVKGACKCVGKRDGEVVFDKRIADSSGDVGISRNPHHWINSTHNLLLKNKEIRTIHIRLIIEFNGKKVCF